MSIKKRKSQKKQSIFSKYLTLSMGVILLGFSILGFMTVYFVTQNWTSERWDTLSSNATSVSLAVTDNVEVSDGEVISTQTGNEVLRLTMEALSAGIGCDIFVADTSGKVLFSSENAVNISVGGSIPAEYVSQAMNGEIREKTTFDGVYSEKYYVVGVPVQVLVNGELVSIGAAFAASAEYYYHEYLVSLVKIFCSAAIITFALVFCLVGLYSYRLAKPLQQMARAARAFGKGDFTKRVTVTGNDEVAELAAAFNNMADSLSASEGMRRSFIANVSHELKTPMTTIAGFIDGILDGTIPKEKQSYYLNIVTVEVKRLSRLVTSMLALSRIDSGALKPVMQSFDLSATVLNTFLTFEQKIEQRHINVVGLEDNKPLLIEGDSDMIHQVVYNLVENAVKFTNEGGEISVAVRDEGDEAYAEITNTGAGIPPEQIGFVFDRFYKTDKSRSMDKNGMGLGLYLVRSIIRLHGGEITAESVENEYTRFSFHLPKVQPEESKSPTVPKDKERKDNPQEGRQ